MRSIGPPNTEDFAKKMGTMIRGEHHAHNDHHHRAGTGDDATILQSRT